MNKMQVQFKLYFKSSRLFLMIFSLIIFFNIVLSNIIGKGNNTGVNMVLLMVLNFILVSLIVMPLVNYSMFPYFLSFGITRKRYLKNNISFNILISAALSFVMTFMYFSQNFLYGEDLSPLYYMGLSSLDHSILTILTSILLYFGLFMLVASLMGLIYCVFYRMGVMYGLSSILLSISVPLFFLKDIIDFVVWGGPTIFVSLGLIIMSVCLSLWTWAVISKAEING